MSADIPTKQLRNAGLCDESNGYVVMRGDIHIATFSLSMEADEYIARSRRIAELEKESKDKDERIEFLRGQSADLNAALINRDAHEQRAVLDDSIFEIIAGRMYCEIGQCGSDPKCFSGADDDVREKWIDAAKAAFKVTRTAWTKLADEPPDVLAAKDWLIVLGILHECQIRLQEGGVRHTWIDGAIGICEYLSKDAVAKPVAEPDAMQFDIGVHFKQLLQTGKRKQLCRDALLENCEDLECMICATAICPHGEPLHFHHDGCPACSTVTKPAEQAHESIDAASIARRVAGHDTNACRLCGHDHNMQPCPTPAKGAVHE